LFRIWPRQFYKVIGPFYQDCVNAEPNAGHEALVELERQGKHVEIATQNVDCLHQKAGSSIVHEIHGTIGTVTWMRCKKQFKSAIFAADFAKGKVPHCPECHGVLKPDLTFFGESLPSEPLRRAKLAFLEADLVMVLGTSLKVAPANTLPGYRVKGTPLFVINHDQTTYDDVADFVSHEQIGKILPELVGMA
jgi:NAD-dependent deacetylase